MPASPWRLARHLPGLVPARLAPHPHPAPQRRSGWDSLIAPCGGGEICLTTATLPSGDERRAGPRLAERERACEGARQEGEGTEGDRGQPGPEEARAAPGRETN